MRIPEDFDARGATQMAVRFLRHAGGTMSYMKLIKLMYMADRKALLKSGHSISGSSFCSMKYGPVLSEVYDLINHGPSPSKPSFWHTHISAPQNYSVSAIGDPGNDEMSVDWENIIDEVFEDNRNLDQWQASKKTHKFPEFTETNSSIPISEIEIFQKEKDHPVAAEKLEQLLRLRELKAEEDRLLAKDR